MLFHPYPENNDQMVIITSYAKIITTIQKGNEVNALYIEVIKVLVDEIIEPKR